MAKIVINSCLENMSKSAHISTVQDSELERLNVAVYNNDDLEQKVAKDFDIRQSKGVVDAAEAQIKTINEKLDIVNKKVEDCESSLQRVCETGGFNSGHSWKMKNKLKSKESNKYTAIEDENGKLLTSEKDIDEETIKHYTKVLENRKIKTNLEEYQIEREKLCEERINEARKNVTPDWTNENVKRVVKELKKKKSRDPHGYSNEIMQAGGEDLEAGPEDLETP